MKCASFKRDIDYGIEEKDSDIFIHFFNMVQHRKQRYTVDCLNAKNENIASTQITNTLITLSQPL